MGKRIKARARGKGGPRYRAPSHRYAGKVGYNLSPDISYGLVVNIIHDRGRSAPLAIVEFPNKTKRLHIVPEGLKVGDTINYWSGLSLGSILPLGKIPEGTKISGIETYPGSGPKLCRTSGTFATIMGKLKDKVRVMFPSGKIKEVNEKCLAMIGVPAGGGRKEKPIVKAGRKHYMMMARGKVWPVVRGVAMNPVDHPFGGKTKPGIPKSVSRNAPPGRKVGAISPRRMGKRKRKG
jgi:large subunit ribosomal protein L2